MINYTELQSKLESNINLLEQLYGTNSEELLHQKQRYLNLTKHFENEHSISNYNIFSAPGRTEIGGNHTDHNHGLVLAAAINMDNIAVAAATTDMHIEITSKGYEKVCINLNNLEKNQEEQFSSKALVKGICKRFKELGYNIGGFKASIDGGVPKGSGLSSSASYEVLIGTILNNLFNQGNISPTVIAQTGQWAENNYFGKPCGLMDQLACAVGGLISIDFKNPSKPIINEIPFDWTQTPYHLIITDTGGDHANLNDDYAAIPKEMKEAASILNAEVLRESSLEELLKNAHTIRTQYGDRAFLRAFHFFNENKRVQKQTQALQTNNIKTFFEVINASGQSSFMYNQNIFSTNHVKEQGLSIGLALSEMVLQHEGAWRVHGGGIAGTIQAFVPETLLEKYINTLENTFQKGSCHKLFIRTVGGIVVF
jgi:galactokinase